MSDEEGHEDDGRSRPPLPPEDRLWRHPSELGSIAPSAPTGHRAHRSSRWALVAAGLAGAGLSLTVVALTGTFRRDVVNRQVIAPVSQLAGPAPVSAPIDIGVSHLVNGIRQSVTGVRAQLVDGVRSGSAVVLGPGGHLVTSLALVTGATGITVSFADGTVATAELAGTDPLTGLAVLRVPDRNLIPPSVNQRRPEVGSVAVTLSGSSDGSMGLVSAGVVRGVSQRVTAGGGDLRDLLETDQATSLESDGGAVIGPDGALIGVCLDPSDDPTDASSRSGWAVPVDVAVRVVEDIAADGRAHHAWLGVDISDAASVPGISTPGHPADHGAVVSSVSAASPAAGVGLRSGDRITAIGGAPVASMADVISVLRRHRPGDRVILDYRRAGQDLSAPVVLRDLPAG